MFARFRRAFCDHLVISGRRFTLCGRDSYNAVMSQGRTNRMCRTCLKVMGE